jgi:hypothetical protein
MTSCDENPYFNGCVCNPRYGTGSNSRVLELSTQTYHCCGEVAYNNLVGDANDSFCNTSGWWQSALIPELAYGASSAGPPQQLLSAQFDVNQIAQQIPLAVMTVDNNGNQSFSCVGFSNYSTPRLVSYLNPNNGSTYAQVVGCVPLNTDQVSIAGINGIPYTTGNFALYEFKGCDTDATKWLQTCTLNGAVSNINNISSQNFKSASYSGTVSNGTSGDSNEIAGMQRLPFIIVLLIFVALVVLLIIFISSNHNYKTILQNSLPSGTTVNMVSTPMSYSH